MKCPFCNHLDTQVIDTRLTDEMLTIKRRRRCLACDRRFNTFEKIELQLPAVVKADGSREEYDETKIRTSMMKALHKRQVSMKEVDAAIALIRQEVLMYNDREINSRIIGDLVMVQLAKLDKVAYIRFASVYRSFNDVTDFTDIIKQVDTK